jgi:hypothetical protein
MTGRATNQIVLPLTMGIDLPIFAFCGYRVR